MNCETQEEVDDLWTQLSDGGRPTRCGWLDDKFGVTWQIIPSTLGKLLQGDDAEKAKQAMLKMEKIDIQKLKDAEARGHRRRFAGTDTANSGTNC